MVAEGVARCGGNSAVGGEERVAHLHDRGTRNASGPGVPHGEAPSSWRDSLLRSLSGRGGRAAMDPAANGSSEPRWSTRLNRRVSRRQSGYRQLKVGRDRVKRSEEHTSELQSLRHLVCRLLLEKKK